MDYFIIIGAVIQAAGTVAAAFITVSFAGRIVKKSIDSYFRSYTDKSFHRRDVLEGAKQDIFIATGIGNNFFETYGEEIKRKLEAGIRVRYMLLDQNRFNEMERYLHGNFAKDIAIHHEMVDRLKSLRERYPALFEFRFFHEYMTVSYICADIWPNVIQDSGLIQIMLYQFNVRPKHSPIMYIDSKANEKSFITTVNSIKDMWQKSDDSPYRREPIRICVSGKV